MAQMSRNESFGLVFLASATLSYAQDVPCRYRCCHASRCCPVSQLCGVSHRRRCVVLASRWSRGQSLFVEPYSLSSLFGGHVERAASAEWRCGR